MGTSDEFGGYGDFDEDGRGDPEGEGGADVGGEPVDTFAVEGERGK